MKSAAACLAAVIVCLAAAQVAAADASYTDPAGDSQGAPDVLAVTAANDTAGSLTFTVRTNQAALAADAALLLEFDVDKNPSTGADGVEYLFLLGSGGWQFLRWDGTNLVVGNAPSANASYANGVATFKLNKADLGGVGTFNFFAVALQIDAEGEVIAVDVAPDGTAVYEYTLSTPPPPPKPLTLRAGAVSFAPAKAVPGKAFAVRVRVTRGDTGRPLASGKVTCRLTVGGRPVRATGRVRAGVATCSLRLPATAQKQRLRGTITITFNGKSVTKTVSKRL
jgi:hypothetical protein